MSSQIVFEASIKAETNRLWLGRLLCSGETGLEALEKVDGRESHGWMQLGVVKGISDEVVRPRVGLVEGGAGEGGRLCKPRVGTARDISILGNVIVGENYASSERKVAGRGRRE